MGIGAQGNIATCRRMRDSQACLQTRIHVRDAAQ